MRALVWPLARPVATGSVYVALLLLGLGALRGMPLSLAPDVDPPGVSISVSLPTASPRVMESEITSRIESAILGLRDVREVRSVSGRGWARIDVDFEPGTPIARAEVLLRDELVRLREEFPPGTAAPQIERASSADTEGGPFLVLRADGPYTEDELRGHLEETLLPRLVAVSGVASGDVYGGTRAALDVAVNRTELGRGRFDSQAAFSVLDRVGGTSSLGSVTREGQRVPVVFENPSAEPALVRDLPVGGTPDLALPLSRVADVQRGWEEPVRVARVNGVPAVQVVLEREPGSNILQLAADAKRALEEAKPRLAEGISIDVLYDQSERIQEELTSLGLRSALSVLAIFLVLALSGRRLRAPIVVLGSVFFSAVVTFVLFRAFGLGMNLITLSGIALAFGMAVDNAIVMLENVAARFGLEAKDGVLASHRPSLDWLAGATDRDGERRRKRAMLWVLASTREVVFPILTGTVTTAVVLGPFLYLSDDLRRYYLPFVLSVSISLIASLGVALTWTPLLTRWALAPSRVDRERTRAREMGCRKSNQPRLRWYGIRAARRFFRGRAGSLRRILDRSTAVAQQGGAAMHRKFLALTLLRPIVTVLSCLLLFSAALWVFREAVDRGALFPGQSDSGLRVGIALASGADVHDTDALVRRFETFVLSHPYRASGYITQVEAVASRNRGSINIRLHPAVTQTGLPSTLKDELVGRAAMISGAEVSVAGYGSGFSTGGANVSPSYQLRLRGPDFVKLDELASDLGRRLSAHPRVSAVDTNASGWTLEDETEMVIVPNRESIARLGVAWTDVQRTLEVALASDLATRDLRTEEGEIAGRVQLGDGEPPTPEQLLATPVRSSNGVPVPLRSLVALEERPVQAEIRRRDQTYERLVAFEFRGPNRVGQRFVDAILENTTLPPGYELTRGHGVYLEPEDERSLVFALALSLALIYMVSAALFESVRLPLVAILAVPLSFIPVPVLFWAMDEPFDRTAYVGLILLAGIAINNALLYVHRAGALVRRRVSVRRAAVRASTERLRPILMTTLTSLVALLPLAVGSEGSEWRALALSAAAGLAGSAVVALWLLPAFFVLIQEPNRRWRMMRLNPATAILVAGLSTIVVNRTLGADPKPEQVGDYAIRSAMTLGGPDAPEEAQFFERLGSLEVDADAAGNVYVLDDGNHRVQVFDKTGTLLRTIGSEGEGPGELSMAATFSVNARGEVAIFDMGTQRVSVFDPAGKLARDRILEEPVKDLLLTDEGVVVAAGMGGDRLVALDANGKEIWSQGAAADRSRGGREINIQTPLQQVGSRLAGSSSNLVWQGSSDAYAVHKIESGKSTQTLTRSFDRQAFRMPEVPEGGKEGEGSPRVVMMVQRSGEGEDGGVQRSATIAEGAEAEEIHFSMDDIQSMLPKHQPDLRAVLDWPDGRLWVVTAEDEGDRMIADEWSADGRYLRRFTLPQDYSFYRVGADGMLYAVAHDEDDYPIVHRLEVTR